ncbi:hypothetical protein CHLRE_10g444750v5 [Chlamydomonas reinhardtii]|uniref:Uncharacterized protein n=1 Tax=Chlamydomonas reinhardtii TaxID=3055 RepID=A0A2K3DAS4_CHLRE|nr:uncharacterized protein CHLRE_10g444750v5 [Chlamydomonas reinhardtii]PNW77621.1 hypothetical protein CHLRE_10g444750v5 [Chlamydomonas reinhardtii]
MAFRSQTAAPASGRLAQSLPLLLFLIILGVGSYMGREQIENAIEASGTFIASQFGGGNKAAIAAAGGAAKVEAPKAKVEAPKVEAPKVEAPKVEAPKVEPAKTEAAAQVEVTEEAARGGATTTQPKVITEIDDKGRKLQILDVPIPEDCYPSKHADYAGDGVVWGLGHKQASAADCCAACKEHQKKFATNKPCNVWVWCGDPSGVCWTMDIHSKRSCHMCHGWSLYHTTGDCWLKHQEKWDNNPDLTTSNLEINHKGAFTAEFRAVHKTSPEMVPWVAGLVPIKKQATRRVSRRAGV